MFEESERREMRLLFPCDAFEALQEMPYRGPGALLAVDDTPCPGFHSRIEMVRFERSIGDLMAHRQLWKYRNGSGQSAKQVFHLREVLNFDSLARPQIGFTSAQVCENSVGGGNVERTLEDDDLELKIIAYDSRQLHLLRLGEGLDNWRGRPAPSGNRAYGRE